MSLDWEYFFSLFTMSSFWRASVTVVTISTLSWVLGLVLGFLVASAKMSSFRWLSMPAKVYVWFFRSVPLLVVLVFVYNLPQLFPSTQPVLGVPFLSGLISLVITEAAYMAEIHRSGLLSVAKGQKEAGHALNIGFLGIQRLIVIPQAFRISMPTLINEYVTIIKLSSLVSAISLPELLQTGQRLYAQNFMVLETLLAVAVYYVVIVSIFGAILQWFENKLDVPSRNPQTLTEQECETLKAKSKPLPKKEIQGPTGQPPALQLKGLSKSYGNHQVLKDINLKIGIGEVVSIIGPSGSGKTTLIRTLNTLETLNTGEVILFGEHFIEGKEIGNRDIIRQGMLKIGMVFQSFNLFPHKTIVENIMLAPKYHGLYDDQNNYHQALSLLDRVGLLAHADKYPHQLSGGQQQRVAIARTLALSPDIILFDEPTSALDPEMVGEVLKVIQDLAKEGMTLIIVTHEMNFALSVSDRVVMMEHGVVQVDASPKNIRNPESTAPEYIRMREFMGIA
jgi:His/Glu/Gln/Arg/opine family amino acid ABC transporter permease subunit